MNCSDARIRIEQLRLTRGISIAELARRTNIDKKRLWYVLNGQRDMRVDEFLKLYEEHPVLYVNRGIGRNLVVAVGRISRLSGEQRDRLLRAVTLQAAT